MDTRRSVLDILGDLPDDQGLAVAPFLQYEVREGGEADELIVLPKAFIAKRNQTFILRLGGGDGEQWPDDSQG